MAAPKEIVIGVSPFQAGPLPMVLDSVRAVDEALEAGRIDHDTSQNLRLCLMEHPQPIRLIHVADATKEQAHFVI